MAHTYTQADKEQARALYEEHGACEAARRIGVGRSTISAWARRYHWSQPDTVQITAEATKAAGEKIARARAETQANLAEGARSASGLMLELVAEQETHKAKDAALITAISLDKLRLELGEVTDRTEHRTVDSLAAEIEELTERLEHTGA